VHTVLANRKGVGHDVPKEVREVLDAAFDPGSLLWLVDALPLVESRRWESRNETKVIYL
jgi:hypothetical protein